MEVLNTANEQVIVLLPSCGKDELDRAVAAVRHVFKTWNNAPADDRRKAI